MSKITLEDLDRLVAIADRDPEFKERLHECEELARKKNCNLIDVIQTAVDWYFAKYPDERYH